MAKKPKEIKPGELFKLHNMVWSYRINPDDSVALVPHKPEEATKAFVPPTLEEVVAFFEQKGYQGAGAFHEYYANGTPPWTDRDGKPIRAWKQKAIAVWFKEDRKIGPVAQKQGNDEEDQYKNMVF